MEVQPGRRIEGKLCRTEVFREELRPESRQEMLKWPARAVGNVTLCLIFSSRRDLSRGGLKCRNIKHTKGALPEESE